MLMAQAIRPPASPVGSVLSDTHSMNSGNGASSSILPGPEERIGGRHGFPHTLAVTAVHNEWIETLLTSMLDDTGLRLAVEQAMARPKTAALLPVHQQPSLRRGGGAHRAAQRRRLGPPRLRQLAICHARMGRHAGVVWHQSDRRAATGRPFPSTCRCPRRRAANSWSPPT